VHDIAASVLRWRHALLGVWDTISNDAAVVVDVVVVGEVVNFTAVVVVVAAVVAAVLVVLGAGSGVAGSDWTSPAGDVSRSTSTIRRAPAVPTGRRRRVPFGIVDAAASAARRLALGGDVDDAR